MQFTPYLNFDGNCREAFTFYADLFGGEILMLQTFGDSPMPEEMCRGREDKVMHARLQIGEQFLMASDDPSESFNKMRGMNIAINVDSPEEAERFYRALSKDGQIQMPLEKTFWARSFAMLTDRFGTPWMINCE
jgi:PhnB protein